MFTFKYLAGVIIVLSAAFFLSDPETGFAMDSYANVMPYAITALFIPSPESWGDEWYQTHRTALEELVSANRF